MKEVISLKISMLDGIHGIHGSAWMLTFRYDGNSITRTADSLSNLETVFMSKSLEPDIGCMIDAKKRIERVMKIPREVFLL